MTWGCASSIPVLGCVAALAACSGSGSAPGEGSGRGPSGGSASTSTGGGSGGPTGGGPTGGGGGAAGGSIIVVDAGPSTGPEPTLTTDVSVIITADNAYGFGYGSASAILNYFGGIENERSDDIFACPVGNGPEAYTVPAPDANAGSFLYIIGYADKSTTQGVLAQLFREGGAPVYTGNGAWQACATGEDYDPGSGGPTLARVNEFIALCNAGGMDPSTTSGGWVDTTGTAAGRVAFGEDNSTDREDPAVGNEFPIACDIDPAARWMWFEWEPERHSDSPFIWPDGDDDDDNPTKDFVLFRLGAEYVPERPR